MQEQDIQEVPPSPPYALYKIKKDQLVLGGAAALIGLLLVVLLHGGQSGFFAAFLATFLISALSNEILDLIIPGRYARRMSNGEFAPAAPARPRSSAARLLALVRRNRSAEEEEPEAEEEGVLEPEAQEEEEEAAPALETGAPARLFPLYHEHETLRLGKVLKTGQRFDPHFNELLGKGIISSAVMGSGKSMANGLIIERAALAGMPAVIFDYKGEYASITELPFAKGLRVGADATFDVHLAVSSPETLEVYAYDLVCKIIEGRYQAVIDLPSYGLGWVDRARIVSAVGKALMAYSAHRQRRGILLIPTLVVLDEAQLYLPENIKYLPAEAKNNIDVLSDLNNAFFAMASNGRSNGYTTIISTPSLTYVAKAFIKSSQIYFFLRHSEKNDLDECMRMLDPYVTRQQMETMPIGCGVVKGFTPTPLIVRFDTKKSRDLAQTPMLERLRMPVGEPMEPLPQRQQPTPNPAKSGVSVIEKLTAILAESFTEEELLAAINRLPDRQSDPEDEDESQAAQAERSPDVEQPIAPAAAAPQRPLRHQEKYARAIAVWQELEGKKLANVRDFAAAMGLGDAKAYNLLCEMDRLGLIHWERRKKKAL